jgi:hypothetical protein
MAGKPPIKGSGRWGTQWNDSNVLSPGEGPTSVSRHCKFILQNFDFYTESPFLIGVQGIEYISNSLN